MANYSKIVDLYFTESGDYFLGQDGDIADTKDELYRGFIQMAHTIISSSTNDWKLEQIGANLTSFLGKPNNPDLARRIQDSIYTEIARHKLVRSAELKVEVLPISESAIAIAIFFTPSGTTKRITLTYTYDVRDNKIMIRNV
jgi:hypothetical protein